MTTDGEACGDVAFVTIELVDDVGTVHTNADRVVAVAVVGQAELQGLGSAAPISDQSFIDHCCTTYRGRALAVIRPTGPSRSTVTVAAGDLVATVDVRVWDELRSRRTSNTPRRRTMTCRQETSTEKGARRLGSGCSTSPDSETVLDVRPTWKVTSPGSTLNSRFRPWKPRRPAGRVK